MKKLDDQNDNYKALTRSKKDSQDENLPRLFAEKASQDSLLDPKTLEAIDNAAVNIVEGLNTAQREEQEEEQHQQVMTPKEQQFHRQTLPLIDDEDLDAFFSDEDDKGVQAVEDLQSVIKRVSKKAANMIDAINQCQERMDNNA